jgi:hypothetical protein
VRSWSRRTARSAVAASPSAHMFSAGTGFAVFCGYAAIAITGGLILFRKRDA